MAYQHGEADNDHDIQKFGPGLELFETSKEQITI